MRLAELVEVSDAVAGTRSRKRKLDLLAGALGDLDADELDAGVSFLSGEPRQDRLELGPTAVRETTAPASTDPSLGVVEVDHALQAIADVPPGDGSRTRRRELLAALLTRATPTEQAWLRSLVLRELRQGALEGLLVQAIAKAGGIDDAPVRRAAMLTGDLRRTAAMALTGGGRELEQVRLEIGTALQPMLAASSPDLDHALEGRDEVCLEAKLDGARLQVHRDGDEVRVFTRNLHEVTDRLPEVVEAVRSLPASTLVLDGEAIGLDGDGRPLPFQETMQRFGREAAGAVGPQRLHPRFFDVLHAEGEDVFDRPLRERLVVLATQVSADLRVDQLVTADGAQSRDFVQRTLASGHEGVMVKDLDAPYEAGRRGSAWRKVKPVHTLDLVVLAVEWGSGRRRGWLSNLHLGARVDDGEGFVMLGKTFKGLTDETLAWQTEQLLAREVERDGHVVHVRPELVVEIALDGVVRSPRYPGGLALRFARVRGYRPDKDPADADTLATVRAIHEGTWLPTA